MTPAAARVPRTVVWTLQLAIFAAAGWAAFLLRFDFRLPAGVERNIAVALVIWIVVKTAAFRLARLDRGWWRYFSTHDAVRLSRVNAIVSAVCGTVIVFIVPSGFPRSVHVLDFLLCTLLSISVRVGVRMVADRRRSGRGGARRRRALIYGAGSAGQMLMREIGLDPCMTYDVAGFIDDERSKQGLQLQGVPVLGTGASLAAIARDHSVEEVLIAMPAARCAGDEPCASPLPFGRGALQDGSHAGGDSERRLCTRQRFARWRWRTSSAGRRTNSTKRESAGRWRGKSSW